ncbi:mucin-5AC-like [Schistocerca gregaria]|uniref:mucin-5AC-like n=1 Tax=Schistocerca gregaria TaxID=7010 RepID=UPI00211EC1C5|nr:mucin-5AC-like [Schistocerca gregaria]
MVVCPRGLLLLLLLLVSELCVSPHPVSACCLEKTTADSSIGYGSADGTGVKPSSFLGPGERSSVPATAMSADVTATKQRNVYQARRLRRSGRRRWVAAGPVRIRNLNSQSKDAKSSIMTENETDRNKTRNVTAKTLLPQYSTSVSTHESESVTGSYVVHARELPQVHRLQGDMKSLKTAQIEDLTSRAVTSRFGETEETSVQPLPAQSTIMFEEETSQRSLEADGERSESSKLKLVSYSGDGTQTTESYISTEQSPSLGIHLQSTSENKILFSDKSRGFVSTTTATNARDSSVLHNNDKANSKHVLPQATLQQLRGFPDSETQQSFSTDHVDLEETTRGGSSPTEPPDTESLGSEVTPSPSHDWIDAGDIAEHKTSIGPPSGLSRLPSKHLWKSDEFYQQTETNGSTTEFSTVVPINLVGKSDHTTTHGTLISSQGMPQSTLKQQQGPPYLEKSVSGKRSEASNDSVSTTLIPLPEENVSLRQLADSSNVSQETYDIIPPLGQSTSLSSQSWKAANVSHPLPQETKESESKLSVSMTNRRDYISTAESSSILPNATIRQLHGPPDNKSESSTSSVTPKQENSTPVKLWNESQVLGSEKTPAYNWPSVSTDGRNNEETSSTEPPLGLSQLPSTRPWKSVAFPQELETVPSAIEVPASALATGEAASQLHVTNAADSNHAEPKATVKQLHGPPDSKIQLYHWGPEKRLPSHRWPDFGVSTGHESQEASSMGHQQGLSRLPSKRLWKSVVVPQKLETVASDTGTPASSLVSTEETSSHPHVVNSADSNHVIPETTVKHGPSDSEILRYPPSKTASAKDRMKANDGRADTSKTDHWGPEKRLPSYRWPNFGVPTGRDSEKASSMGPQQGLSRLPSKRLWTLVNNAQPMITKDRTTESASVLTNAGATLSHGSVIDTAVSSHVIPKATVKQLRGPPDRETEWYPLSEFVKPGGRREENSSPTESSQTYGWGPEKTQPSYRRPDGMTIDYERQETSIPRPPPGHPQVPSKDPWDSSDISERGDARGPAIKQLLTTEKQAGTLKSSNNEQYQLKEEQNVPVNAVTPKTEPSFLPILRAAHLLLEAAKKQADGPSDTELQRSSTNETATALRESELSRITKQLSTITQLLISGLLLNVLTTKQLQGCSLDSPLLNSTSEELLGPTLTSLNLSTADVVTAAPGVASSYPVDSHYKDTSVWNTSSETSTGASDTFSIRSWVSRPIPVVPLPEGVSDVVGDHPSPDGLPPPPPPDFTNEELDGVESVGGSLASGWHTTTTQSPQGCDASSAATSQPPANYWDTTQSPYNYWYPTTTTTQSPYNYWYQNMNTTQYPYNYWNPSTTTTQSPQNYWNTNEATTQRPYNYWGTSTTAIRPPYNYWYTNKDTTQNPLNYWGTTTSTTPSPYDYWNTNQNPQNFWETTNTTTASPYDYGQTATTTTQSPYSYWSTTTQDPRYWYTTPTSLTPTKSPYEIWYDYWYGNTTTSTKSPYESWYDNWYGNVTTTTKSPYENWYDTWYGSTTTTTTTTTTTKSPYENWYDNWYGNATTTTKSPYEDWYANWYGNATTTTKSPYENWYNYWYSSSTTTTKSPYDSWFDYWSKKSTTTTTPTTSEPQSQYNWYYGWPTTTTSRPPPTNPTQSQYNWYSGWPTTTSPSTTEPPTTQRPWYDYWSTPSTTTSKPPTNEQSQYNWYYGWPTQTTPKSTEPPTTQRPWYDYWSTTSRPPSTQSQNNWFDSWRIPTTTQRPWYDYWSTTSRPHSGQSQYDGYHNWLGTTTATATSQPPTELPTTTRSPWYDYWGTTKRPYVWYNSWGNGPAATTTTTTTESPTSQAQATGSPPYSYWSPGQQPADPMQSSDNTVSSGGKPLVQQLQGTHYNPDGSYVLDMPGHHEEGFYRVPAGGGAPVFVKQGYYTYTDGTGRQHTVSYVADEYGYRTSDS